MRDLTLSSSDDTDVKFPHEREFLVRSGDGQWPFDGLNLKDATGHGWQPLPFTQFILKIHSRCNLNCHYCYVYNSLDAGWRRQPVSMNPETLALAGRRIAEHAERFGIAQVEVIFHGGEPLLAGPAGINTFAALLNRELGQSTKLMLGLQTNAVLLTEDILHVLDRWDIKVGVSLDGTAPSHDRSRPYRNGEGSYLAAVRGTALLTSAPFRHLFSGLLCVADLAADPVACYAALAAFRPPMVDFLLPHANWADRPINPGTPYADWLIAIFDAWYEDAEQEVSVRLFADIIALLLGRPSRSESVGLSPATHLVIEANGDIEQVDSLKTAYDGAAATGLNIRADPLESALRHPLTIARQLGRGALCPTCESCPLGMVCGGGHFAHRYRPGRGFLNPSVYGPTLARLITHIGARVYTDLGMDAAAAALRRHASGNNGGGRCARWTSTRLSKTSERDARQRSRSASWRLASWRSDS
jgi:uncharacterized protein